MKKAILGLALLASTVSFATEVTPTMEVSYQKEESTSHEYNVGLGLKVHGNKATSTFYAMIGTYYDDLNFKENKTSIRLGADILFHPVNVINFRLHTFVRPVANQWWTQGGLRLNVSNYYIEGGMYFIYWYDQDLVAYFEDRERSRWDTYINTKSQSASSWYVGGGVKLTQHISIHAQYFHATGNKAEKIEVDGKEFPYYTLAKQPNTWTVSIKYDF